MAAALLMAALVRSFLYLCLFRFAFVLWRLLPRPAFMVTERVALEGLWDSLGVDETIVPHCISVGQVASLRGEGFLHTPLLEKEGGVVPDDPPCDLGGDIHGDFSCRSESSNKSL